MCSHLKADEDVFEPSINRVWAQCVLLGMMTLHLMALEARAASQAEQGILDLRDYDFERDGPVQLQGQWRMWWSTLASPYELLDDVHSIRVPVFGRRSPRQTAPTSCCPHLVLQRSS